MSLTVGLVKEIRYIARSLGYICKFTIAPLQQGETPIIAHVSWDRLDVWYQNKKIWSEDISDSSFFGVESVDTISRIIACIDNGDNAWVKLCYDDQST